MQPTQAPIAPPIAPPKGSAGPKPMTAGMPPPTRGAPATVAQPSDSVDPRVVAQSFQQIFGLYAQLETNPKQRSETEQKFNIMMDKLEQGGLQPATVSKLQVIAEMVEQSNHQGASQAFRDLTQRCWADVKDFSNALKVLSSFRQKYGQ